MATQKPISTISYNSEAFLRDKLNTWLEQHIIQSYQYICHKGEDGDKDHIHLRIEPNKKLDPMDLQDKLKEFVGSNPKPLGCRPFRPSKEEDWYLYAVHDPDYLKIKYRGGDKGEKLPYKWQDIKAPEDYDTEIAFIRAKAYLDHTAPSMTKRIMGGENLVNMMLEGENVYMLNAIMRAVSGNDYSRLQKDYLEKCNQLSMLQGAVYKAGFSVEADDAGNPVLIPLKCKGGSHESKS